MAFINTQSNQTRSFHYNYIHTFTFVYYMQNIPNSIVYRYVYIYIFLHIYICYLSFSLVSVGGGDDLGEWH